MLNFGIIGCGNISSKHIHIASNLLQNRLNLKGLCDFEYSSFLNQKSAFDLKNVEFYDEYINMVKDLKLDLVSILTPSGSHFEIASRIISETDCAVVIEKPICLKYEDALALDELTKNNQNKVYVLMQNRFNKPITALKKLIESDALGKIHLCTARVRWARDDNYYSSAPWRGTWLNDGGALINQGIHFLDLLIWLNGNIKEVAGMSTNALAEIEAEDTLTSILKFENGALGTFEVSTATRPKDIEGSLSILGSKGSVEIGGFACNKVVFSNFTDPKYSFSEADISNPIDNKYYSHHAFYENVLLDLTINKKQTFLFPNEGTKCIEVAHAIYDSVFSGENKRIDGNYINSRLGK